MHFPGLEGVAAHLALQEFLHQPVEAISHQFQIRRIYHTDCYRLVRDETLVIQN